MIQDRRGIILRFTGIMLVMTVNTFAFIAKDISNRKMVISSKVHAKDRNELSRRRKAFTHFITPAAATDDDNDGSAFSPLDLTHTNAVGLYKQYAEYAAQQLLGTGWLENDISVPKDLSANQASARGTKVESIVRITTQALIPKTSGGKSNSQSLIRYARITLLETVPLNDDSVDEQTVSSDGIQVLNFVVLPRADTTLPVLGIDLVSLPGSKHLLLLDAQPMVQPNPHEDHWKNWYNQHVVASGSKDDNDEEVTLKYAWGGDFPEAVQQYVSKYALWTRLQNLSEGDDDSGTMTTSSCVDAIQGDLFVAFQAHVDAYLELLGNFAENHEAVKGENHQPSYLDYRRNNDPAKPMLNSLYGAEWTQSLLDNVLFPKD